MNTLISFIAFLLLFTGGAIALTFTVLFLSVLAVVAVKAFRLLIALFNFSISEPELKIVACAQRLNKRIKKNETQSVEARCMPGKKK